MIYQSGFGRSRLPEANCLLLKKPRPDARNYFCCSYCCCSRCRCSHSHKERCSPDCCRTPRRTSKCCLFLSLRASLHEESLPTTLFLQKLYDKQNGIAIWSCNKVFLQMRNSEAFRWRMSSRRISSAVKRNAIPAMPLPSRAITNEVCGTVAGNQCRHIPPFAFHRFHYQQTRETGDFRRRLPRPCCTPPHSPQARSAFGREVHR